MGIHLKKIGHINMKVTDSERAKAFYRDILGFCVSEEDPDHGGVFMTLGDDFHTLDLSVVPEDARLPDRTFLGVSHVAFQVHSYQALREAYQTLVDHGVTFTAHLNEAWSEAKTGGDQLRGRVKAARREWLVGNPTRLVGKLTRCAWRNGSPLDPWRLWREVSAQVPDRRREVAHAADLATSGR